MRLKSASAGRCVVRALLGRHWLSGRRQRTLRPRSDVILVPLLLPWTTAQVQRRLASRGRCRARDARTLRARAPRRGAGEGSRTGGASGNFLLPRRPLCPRRRSVRPSPRPPENSCSVAVRLSKRAAALGLALALASGMACVAAFAVDMVSCGSSRGGGGGAGGEDERPGLQAGGGGFTGFYITAADVQL